MVNRAYVQLDPLLKLNCEDAIVGLKCVLNVLVFLHIFSQYSLIVKCLSVSNYLLLPLFFHSGSIIDCVLIISVQNFQPQPGNSGIPNGFSHGHYSGLPPTHNAGLYAVSTVPSNFDENYAPPKPARTFGLSAPPAHMANGNRNLTLIDMHCCLFMKYIK